MSKFRIYNPTLDPTLWDEYQHLDPEVRVNLLRTAYDFYRKTKFPAPIIDVYLMGSSANYNWTPDSDVDVHVIIDYSKLQMAPETATKMVKTVGAQWNLEHKITVKNHKVEMNLQNVKEIKPHVTGIYSLVKDQWIRKPVPQMPQLDKNIIQAKYQGMRTYVQNAMASGDRETMKKAKEYVDAFRQYGLDTCGELSYENIVFKILRAKGLIKQLKDAITATYDQEMTVDEVGLKHLKSRLPRDPSQYHYTDQGELNLDKLTLDNLLALRQKAARGIAYLRKQPEADPAWLKKETDDFARISQEIKRRMAYINKPVMEAEKPTKIKWVKEDPDDDIPYYKSADGRFSIEPLYAHTIRPSGFYLKDNKENKKYHVSTLASAKEKAERILNPGPPPPPPLTPEQLQAAYDKAIANNQPLFAADIAKNALKRGITLKTVAEEAVVNTLPEAEKIFNSIPYWDFARAINITHDLPQVKVGASPVEMASFLVTTWALTGSKEKKFESLPTIFSIIRRKLFGDRRTKSLFRDLYHLVEIEIRNRLGEPKIDEGYGAGIPEQDRLKIVHPGGHVERWRIRSKDAPKTPKMTDESPSGSNVPQKLSEGLILEGSPEIKTLKKNKKPLTDEERKQVMDAGAVWHMGKDGGPSPAVWKAELNGKTWYVTATHRYGQVKKTLKGAISAYHNGVKQSA